jgi:putative membrane protein insertion efficiency factor
MLSFLPIAIIRLYQRALSPLLPKSCRFYPSCSHYGIQALRHHGFLAGMALLLWRLARCQPFGGSGEDSVPDKPWAFAKFRKGRRN